MADKRITKDAANYNPRPEYSGFRRRCEDCSMFREPSNCTLVEGYIARRGTCRFWEPKKGGTS